MSIKCFFTILLCAAQAHRQRPGDQDEFWNVIPWTQEGKSCFKLEKARNRRPGYMLTAHSDKVRQSLDNQPASLSFISNVNHNLSSNKWPVKCCFCCYFLEGTSARIKYTSFCTTKFFFPPERHTCSSVGAHR